jgi:multidrug resistance protein, MATE family
MMNPTAKLGETRVFVKESWSMGWPMILMMFFHFFIGIADVYVAGYLGTEVLAAVGYVGQLYWTLMILANGITVGTVSMISQAHGAGSKEGVANLTANSLIVGVAISGILTALTQFYYAGIVRMAGMPAEIQEIAEIFIRIFSLVLIPTYVMIITGGVLRASGRVRVAMINALVASSLNVVLDLVLGFGWGPVPALGFRGIAWATAAATTVGMVLNLSHMFVGHGRIRLTSLMNPLSQCMKNLLRLGVPSALQQTAWNAGTLVVYFLVGRIHEGEITALAAMTAGLRIEAIIFLPIFAFNMASAVLTGSRLGVGDVAGARSGALVTAGLSLSITLLPAAAIFVLAPNISSLLTNDTAVIAEMARYLRVNMVGMPFLAVGVSLSGALQGAGDTFATMRIIFTGMWLFRIPLILVVIYALRLGALAVWCCLTISIVLMCGLLAVRFFGNRWITASVDKKSNTMLWEACTGDAAVVAPRFSDEDAN